MRRPEPTAAVMILAVALAACATSTPYQLATPSPAIADGLSETRLATDRYRVTFAGNYRTSREQVQRDLLHRAAELAVQQGYDWFEAADPRIGTSSQAVVDTSPFLRPGFMWNGDNGFSRPTWRQSSPRWGNDWRDWDPFWGEPIFANRTQGRMVDRIEATAEIVLHKGPKPEGAPRAYDAREVLSHFGPDAHPLGRDATRRSPKG